MKPFKPENLYTNIHNYLYARQEGIEPDLLEEKIEEITHGDSDFKQQLLPLYITSFREIIEDLNSGKLYAKDHLRHIRHKHKATLKMLGLDCLEAVMFRMQELVELSALSPEEERELAVVVVESKRQAEEIVRQLKAII